MDASNIRDARIEVAPAIAETPETAGLTSNRRLTAVVGMPPAIVQ
jgi:hypothetical protein